MVEVIFSEIAERDPSLASGILTFLCNGRCFIGLCEFVLSNMAGLGIKGIVHSIMKIWSSFTHSYAIPNMYNVHFSMDHISKFNSQFDSVFNLIKLKCDSVRYYF